MTPLDPNHWLYRLAPDDWLLAARHERAQAMSAFAKHDRRTGVACARRAAGMAMNALLVLVPNDAWGRSYVEHLRAARGDEALPLAVREAAGLLVDASLSAPRLVQLGGTADDGLVAAATSVIGWCAERVERLTSSG